MKNKVLLAILCIFLSIPVSAENIQRGFDLDSSFALQDVPIYEGTEEFTQKLNNIRETENREPLGLVLCGGSARAFAHLGVIKALEENEIKPDFIVANSMGAIIGMLYAYGFSSDKILEIVEKINLPSYFDPGYPFHGGVISVRKFRALINELLGKESTDLSECAIPIVVLTEDLGSKRQIWHSRGDFARIMTAAFAMPVMIEYTKFTTPDGKKYDLFDSGCIDIGGISVAEQFSQNLIVSSAFYDRKVNYNNVIVFLNRMSAIAKERACVEDLKGYKPLLIRNNVEKYSFMSFDKAHELTDLGYETAQSMMDSILELPHANRDLSEVRKRTDSLADRTIELVERDVPLRFKETHFGLKLWPTVSSIDFKDFSLYDKIGISEFVFMDSKYAYLQLGANEPFTFQDFSADAKIILTPYRSTQIFLFGSYSFNYQNLEPKEAYTAAQIKFTPEFFPYFLDSFYINGELLMDSKFKSKEILFTSGTELSWGDDGSLYLFAKPYYFMSGNKLVSLSGGAGINTGFQYNLFTLGSRPETKMLDTGFTQRTKTFGFSSSLSLRGAFFNNAADAATTTKLYASDYYRGKSRPEATDILGSSATELYYTDLFPDFSIIEVFIIKEFKAGAFLDLYFGDGTQTSLCPGAFGRMNLSLLGLSDFIMEAGGGYEINSSSFFGYFTMKTRM